MAGISQQELNSSVNALLNKALDVGDKALLETEYKTDLVGAVNEVKDELVGYKADNAKQIPHLGATTNVGDAYSVTTAETILANQKFTVKFNAVSTAAPTLKINTGTASPVKKANGGNAKLYASAYTLFWDGTNFTLLGEGGEYGTAPPEKVSVGYTVATEDNGIQDGTFTADATAIATEIASGKTAYVNGALLMGSGVPSFPIVSVSGSNARGIAVTDTIRYFLAMNKNYYVGFRYDTASPNLNLFVFDKRTGKVVWRLACDSALSDSYIHYNSSGAGLLVGGRWLIYNTYTAAGGVKTVKRDILGTAVTSSMPTSDAWAHGWLSADETHGYLCSYGKIVKYDANGNQVWVNTTGSTGYKRILGEYGNYVYIICGSEYVWVINKDTGVNLGDSYSGFPTIRSGFLVGSKMIVSSIGNVVYVLQINETTFVPSATALTAKTYALDAIPANTARTKVLIGRSNDSPNYPRLVSDLYDISNLATAVEVGVSGLSVQQVTQFSESELISASDYLGGTGAAGAMTNAYYINYVGSVT